MTFGVLGGATPFLFFTGKGGVGKTSVSTATALALADAGKRVLLVSTDAASNLDEMLGVPLKNEPVPVPGAPGLSVLNIDPTTAAAAYRSRVLSQLGSAASDVERDTVKEQLSGACTTEIAAFDEFAGLLSGEGVGFDHVVFDTAPTGHTLRLLSLPKAWTGFLEGNDRGASCLGPHSGLKMQEARFREAMRTLMDPARTTVVLVTSPEPRAIAEAGHAAEELAALGLSSQRLVVNGVFRASERSDSIARALEERGARAMEALPPSLAGLPRDEVPLRPRDTIGLDALRALLSEDAPPLPVVPLAASPLPAAPIAGLVDELERAGHGLVMVMGKGGVGKTTLAAALALALAERGHHVHLSTTDPAAHPRARPRRAGEGAPPRGSALPLHRGGRGLPRVFADHQRGEEVVRGARHSTDGALAALDGRDGRVPPTVAAHPRGRHESGAHHDAAHASSGSEPHAHHHRHAARDDACIAGRSAPGRPASRAHRALRVGGLASRLFVVPWFARPPVGAAALRAVVQSPTTDLGA
jgi:arsenite-transporting ATPase